MSKPGMVRGTEPAARTTSVPVISTVDPSFPAIRTRWSPEQRAAAVEHGHAPTLQQARQPAEQLVHDLLLALLADRELDRRLRLVRPGRDAEAGGRAHGAADGGRLQERLGRHAAAVQAGATHLVELHEADGEPGGGAVEGGGVPTRSTPDDDHVEVLCSP